MRHMKYTIFSLLMCVLAFASCDEGRIAEKKTEVPAEGFTVKLTGTITGIDSWPSAYRIVLAAFKEDNSNAAKSVQIFSNSANNDQVSAKLSGLDDEVTEVELCAIDNVRDRIVSFVSVSKDKFTFDGDTMRIELGTVDVGMYQAIQENVFSAKCIACHGLNGSAPRNLFLTAGNSYGCLVNVDSKSNPDYKLVNPNNASKSLLPMVLESDGLLHHDHADILEARTKTDLINLIKAWINNGAQE